MKNQQDLITIIACSHVKSYGISLLNSTSSCPTNLSNCKVPDVTKHRNGMERNGIYRNKPEYTGTRQNDAGMKRNGQEWYRNVPERAGMTAE